MILFNNNFSSPITKTILSEYFTTITTPNDLNPMNCITNISGEMLYASGSTLVGNLIGNAHYTYASKDTINSVVLDSAKIHPKNFQIVTEQFLKVLDKVYTKIWNESFTETGIYSPTALASIFSGFSVNNYGFNLNNKLYTSQFWCPTISTMRFYNFVSRCITAGVLDETDRLTNKDQIFVSQPSNTISTNIDTVNNIITFNSNSVIDIQDFNTQEGSYLYGKKLYLLMTPFIANASVINSAIKYNTISPEPVSSSTTWNFSQTTGDEKRFYSPFGFFKPKSPDSKFGSSVPLATHLFWRIGTPEDKEMALLEGTEVPEIIFDHLDRVSHIDTFQLKVKYGPIQFA